MDDIASAKERESAFRWILAATIIYIFISPFFGGIFLYPLLAFDNLHAIVFIRFLFSLLYLCIPLSVPVAIFFMWYRFFQKRYATACSYSGLPIILTIINSLFSSILNVFF